MYYSTFYFSLNNNILVCWLKKTKIHKWWHWCFRQALSQVYKTTQSENGQPEQVSLQSQVACVSYSHWTATDNKFYSSVVLYIYNYQKHQTDKSPITDVKTKQPIDWWQLSSKNLTVSKIRQRHDTEPCGLSHTSTQVDLADGQKLGHWSVKTVRRAGRLEIRVEFGTQLTQYSGYVLTSDWVWLIQL